LTPQVIRMSVPDFQAIMLPLLRLTGDERVHTVSEARDSLAAEFGLSVEDLAQLLPSGRQTTWANRVAWAKSYLDQAGLVESPGRGRFKITPRGREVLERPPEKITIKWLGKYPEFAEFRSGRRSEAETESAPLPESESPETPEEQLEAAYERLRTDLSAEIIRSVKGASPQFFERLVVDLLVKMGYGGSREEAGRAVGRGGDEGIDGIINEDRLGLDVVYIQAKRWTGTVGRPEIQKFVGALHGKRARKGIFITTGTFSSDARGYVEHIDPRVVLIDGRELAEYMIDFGIGLSTRITYEVKKIDSDYFVEDEE
jgi:restriction system protein